MKNLKLLRKQINKTQLEIANYLNISVQSYCNYEKEQRQPTPDMLIRIADYFNVSIDYLLGRTKNTSPEYVSKKASEIESIYNQLKPDLQARAMGYIQALLDSQNKEKNYTKLSNRA